jgi:predicted  nucleic acid-binding Zn-ribbon protein
MDEVRPEQRPAADRVYRRWSDLHRINYLDKVLRQVARQAAVFDSTPSPDELAHLTQLLDKAEEAIHNLLESIEELGEMVAEMQTAVDQIKADKDAGRSEWQVLGVLDDDEMLERLSRLYGLDNAPSQNRLHGYRWNT